MLETTAQEAALLAGLGVGMWNSEEDVRRAWEEERRFQPELDSAAAKAMKDRWAEAVKRA